LGGTVASRKVAGSIPDGVTGIYQLHSPSGLTGYGVDPTSNIKRVPGIFSWERGGEGVKADGA